MSWKASRKLAICVCNFIPDEANESSMLLKLIIGDRLEVIEENDDWYRGVVSDYNFAGMQEIQSSRDLVKFARNFKEVKLGIFPKAFVNVVTEYREKNDQNPTIHEQYDSSSAFPIVSEIRQTLQTWLLILQNLFMQRSEKTELLKKAIIDLTQKRKKFFVGKLSTQEKISLPKETANLIDCTNSDIGIDMVVRDKSFAILDPGKCNFIQLYRFHKQIDFFLAGAGGSGLDNGFSQSFSPNSNRQSYASISSVEIAEDSNFKTKTSLPKELTASRGFTKRRTSYLYSMRISIKKLNLSYNPAHCEIMIGLHDGETQITETTFHDYIQNEYSTLHSVFCGFSSEDLRRPKMHIIIQVIEKHTNDSIYCQVTDAIPSTLRTVRTVAVSSNIREFFKKFSDKKFVYELDAEPVKMYVHDIQDGESSVSVVKQIITNQVIGIDSISELVRSPVQSLNQIMIFIQPLRTILGGKKTSLEESTSISSLNVKPAVANKMDVSNTILPCEYRNAMYITIGSAAFEKIVKHGLKSLQVPKKPNIEVVLCVCNRNGDVVKNAIIKPYITKSMLTSYYITCVSPKSSKPVWKEVVSLNLKPSQITEYHLRFVFRLRSKNEGQEKVIALAHCPVVNKNLEMLQNGIRDLIVYRVNNETAKDNKNSVKEIVSFDLTRVNQSYMLLDATTDDILPDWASPPKRKASISSINSTSSLVLNPDKTFYNNPTDWFQIKIELCSTKIAQNKYIFGLLMHKLEGQNVKNCLIEIKRSLDSGKTSNLSVKPQEVFILFHDIFDALFSLMLNFTDEESKAIQNIAFDVFILILELLLHNKTQQFGPAAQHLDIYIEQHLDRTLLHMKLVELLNDCLSNATKALCCLKQVDITCISECMKNLDYLVAFIVTSRIRYIENLQHVTASSEEVNLYSEKNFLIR